ncbi:DNA repair protein RecN [Testudinibacter sp. TR-2022]|uniref:DNA repair protein RecN n=1 Tax=Testudinibacter sp. TR-2022 TaxID=2585029 RepID=UPI0011189B5E|nr:DNA repair protein RecN [Testudinibacter sp. TR-2022]TNH05257.1 DNA repair protein RecN [Pasteurellaceae bacterium Phil31]TNH06159.1 DNA repair protein RecN [Testudinibacter sp. TR-2022]TNH07734.1 DNA repair protein RecN [Testudinibacter sp. TR-2022]TNH16540.1 DNA repair protein RecN [Testudinibacter sp. TR-2022]TNH20884.1 DNA repair protein RecN [Testudinibacter sp. TR-2022]
MLTHLNINNFAIVNQLDLALQAGMSVITGETGAGKSIAMDALGLCLGDRVESSMIRHGQERGEIRATFQLSNNSAALVWLQQHELEDMDTPRCCTLRRVIRNDGRSKAFINNCPVPAAQLRELGALLIQINGQHSSQRLLKSEEQLLLLDQFCHNQALLQQMAQAYQHWKQTKQQLKQFQQQLAENEAKKQLLQYQVEELNEFNLQPDEYLQLEQQQRCLANAEQITQLSQSIGMLLSENEAVNIEAMLNKAERYCEELSQLNGQYHNVASLLQDALIQVQEASSELQTLTSEIEQDPYLLAEVEQRLGTALQLAKKHHISPEQLHQHHAELKQQLANLTDISAEEQQLQQQLESAVSKLTQISQMLHQSRLQGAQKLSEQITALIKQLAMENAEFEVMVKHNSDNISTLGADEIVFMLRSNLGQLSQPLVKIASGGELSRIALAIQVLTADKLATPTLVFDEVDVGISGATATVVGKLMRQLAQKCQILCVTHLPQVAAYGHQHFSVQKSTQDGTTITEMTALDNKERVYALSRLLSGSEVTSTTLANAKELLKLAS